MDEKQTKISPEILDVDSSRKPISLDGKKNHTKTRVIFLKLQSVFIFCLYCFFLHFYSYEL